MSQAAHQVDSRGRVMRNSANYRLVIFSLLGLSALIASFAGSAAESPQRSAQWSVKMQSLYHTLSALMTDVSSDERFKNPKNRSAIEANAKKLSELAHELKGKSPDQDPSVAIFGSLFSDQAKLAYQSFKEGHLEYSREILRSIPGYCIACHTRTNYGPDFASLPIEPTSKDLSGLAKGEFYASTRQYSRALREFGTVIDDTAYASTHPVEWSRAIKYALAIAVRVKQDPKQAKSITDKVIRSAGAPFFMKEDAGHWNESIDAWLKEPTRTATDEEGLYSEAVRLLGQAHEVQKYPLDHGADVLYLRASSAVHDQLQAFPSGRHSGEAYLMAGICYEVLSSFHIGEIQDIYYEACVRTHPHSTLAESCYHRYQESVFFGYTGSAGTEIPQDEKEKLGSLEKLAKPEAAVQGTAP